MLRGSFLCILIFLFLPWSRSFGTHIVGGEMNYTYLGNNNYRVTFTIYRDCFNGQAPYDNPASIAVYAQNGSLISNNLENLTVTPIVVPNAINSPCLDPPTNVCYEVAQYIFTINVPPGSGAATIVYQRCCRNYSTANIANVQGTGVTYVAVITDPLIAAVNSNPVFNDWAPTFICKDAPFTFDHSATDPDGDSLVYELSNPYEGGSQVNRAPSPPPPPPYTPVTFLNPYSVTNPFGGVPLQINPTTGILTATPNNEGQYVYGVSVKEYRNGVLLGETRRDFQVNVVLCPQLTVASIYSPTIACGSLTANFVSNSFHALTYKWDFGDPTNSNSDTSLLENPSYTYPDTGSYLATLIAYSPENELCNDTVTGIVYVYPEFMTEYYVSNTHCSNVFEFSDLSYGLNGTSTFWFWDFGDNSFASYANPVHSYNNPGVYNVRLITSADSACLDTMVKTVHVLQNPIADFSLAIDTCSYTIQADNISQHAASYRWDFGDFGIDFFDEGSHKYRRPGVYDVQLIVATDSFCIDSSTVQITIPPVPIPDFSHAVQMCDSNVVFLDKSLHATRLEWSFGDGSVSEDISPVHTYSLSGSIPVTLTAVSEHNCRVSIEKDIFFISRKEASFDSWTDSCSGITTFTDVTANAAFYYWDFGDGNTSTEKNPAHKFLKEGNHSVVLTLNGESQCADSVLNNVNTEFPLGEKIYIPNTFTPNGDGVNDIFIASIYRPCEIYSITIFNRWGQKVFFSDDAANFNWDGSFNGEKLAEDVYVYILESGNTRQQGSITILR
jgi:gliding motility-associated-like protein